MRARESPVAAKPFLSAFAMTSAKEGEDGPPPPRRRQSLLSLSLSLSLSFRDTLLLNGKKERVQTPINVPLLLLFLLPRLIGAY